MKEKFPTQDSKWERIGDNKDQVADGKAWVTSTGLVGHAYYLPTTQLVTDAEQGSKRSRVEMTNW